jgi:hypothetical protein
VGLGCGNFGGLGWSVVAWREGEAFGRRFFGGFCRSLAECFVPTMVGIFGVGDRDSVRDFCLLRLGCCEPKFFGLIDRGLYLGLFVYRC